MFKWFFRKFLENAFLRYAIEWRFENTPSSNCYREYLGGRKWIYHFSREKCNDAGPFFTTPVECYKIEKGKVTKNEPHYPRMGLCKCRDEEERKAEEHCFKRVNLSEVQEYLIKQTEQEIAHNRFRLATRATIFISEDTQVVSEDS